MTTTATVPPSAPAPKPRCPQLAALIPVSAPHLVTADNPHGWAWDASEERNICAVLSHVRTAVVAGFGAVVFHAPHGCTAKPTPIIDGHLHTTQMRAPSGQGFVEGTSALLREACDTCAQTNAAVVVWAGPPHPFDVYSVGDWLRAFPWDHPALNAVIVDSAGWPLCDSFAFQGWFRWLGSIVGSKLGYEGPSKASTRWAPDVLFGSSRFCPESCCSIGHWFACSKRPDLWDVSRPPSLMLLTATDADKAAYRALGWLPDENTPRAVERAIASATSLARVMPATVFAVPMHRLGESEKQTCVANTTREGGAA